MFVNKTHEEAHEALKAGEVDKAITLYTAVLKEFPKNCNVLSDRGVAYLHANDQQKCYADLTLTIELEPQRAFHYAARAFAKSHFKDLNGAVLDYEKAVQLDPDDAVAHNNLGLLLEQKGYQEEANKRFERADKLSKAEDNLLNVVNDLESPEKDPEIKAEKTEIPKVNSPSETINEQDSKVKSGKEEFKKVFTSKSQFKEFIAFVKNGFKLK